jgi:hypothetical protein
MAASLRFVGVVSCRGSTDCGDGEASCGSAVLVRLSRFELFAAHSVLREPAPPDIVELCLHWPADPHLGHACVCDLCQRLFR